MKIYYDAKYTETLTAYETAETYGNKLQAVVGSKVLRIALWLIVCLWLGGVVYFFVYPLLPNIQQVKMKIARYDPYLLGYTATTQLFTSLVPPVYDLDSLEKMAGGTIRTIEYVDPERVTISNLEEKGTMLELPAVNIKGKVVDGVSQEAMMRGFWHYPLSSVPGKRGNTVLIGHRFQKLPPNTDTFFNLDSVRVGDAIIVSQGDEDWSYTVVSVTIHEKDDSAVLASSGEYRLTLITCTPLWTAQKRLVVTAVQDRVDSVI